MNRALITGNCQASGLSFFLRRALPHWEIRDLPHLATFYGEFSEERIAADHAWADIVFFHHKHDGAQDYPTQQPKVPMSVWYQSGPFIAHTSEEDWIQLRQAMKYKSTADVIEAAVMEMNLNYTERWYECLSKMMIKERNEQVPQELCMSDLMAAGLSHQLQLTCNHPTSLVFFWWAERICKFLGEEQHPGAISELECYQNPNLAGLPCEESATTGARKHMALQWGGRPEDDESGRLICRQRLGLV